MYENYLQLCSYCQIKPTISIEVWKLSDQSCKIQLLQSLEALLKSLELNSKPKTKEREKPKARLKDGILEIPYTEQQMLVKNVRHYNCTNMHVDDMIEIKNSIQSEFHRREQAVSFKEEKIGLELVVTQSAQMRLFDSRTTVRNSKLYNQKTK